MNLQVDFMLDSERRSGSSVRSRFIIMVVAVLIPVVGAILFGALWIAQQAAHHDLLIVEQQKKQVEPEHLKVKNLTREYAEAKALHDALAAWRASRMDAYALLRGLQTAVPPSMQLRQMTLSERMEDVNRVPARLAALLLQGKVAGNRPEEDVRRLERALLGQPPFDELVEKVAVQRFSASDTVGEQHLRVFDLECVFKPRLIKP